MIVDTVPTENFVGGETAEVPVVAGRIGPEQSAEASPVADSAIAAQPEATQATPEPTKESTQEPKSEELFWAEIKLLGALSEREECRLEIESLLEKAKERKRKLEESLGKVRDEIPDLEQELADAREASLLVARDIMTLVRDKKLPIREQAQTATAEQANDAPVASGGVDPDGWKRIKTSELLTNAKGVGKAKIEAICDLVPTLGDLENLRAEASKAGKQFKEMLPKGCGQSVSDLLENRIGEVVCKWAKDAAGASGKPASVTLAEQLVGELRQLAQQEPWRKEDCVPDDKDTQLTHDGFKAFNEGKPFTDLPTQDIALARQWILGWVCAEVIKQSSESTAASDSSK